MNDFLDRLATKAIGSEAMLAPRLPSLFEPLQRVPIRPLAEPDEAPMRRRDVASKVPTSSVTAPAPSRSLSVAERAESRTATVMPDESLPVPKPVAALPRDVSQSLPIEAVAARPPEVQPSGPPFAPVHPATDPSLPAVQTRQPRLAPIGRESLRSPRVGSLLPATMRVFVTPRAMSTPAPARQASAMRMHAAPAGKWNEASSEPVVHVSIGRLEVRAAGPVTGVAPPRRDGPRPDSLDDYLRQRGGKAAP
jgi:hypothetical protein